MKEVQIIERVGCEQLLRLGRLALHTKKEKTKT